MIDVRRRTGLDLDGAELSSVGYQQVHFVAGHIPEKYISPNSP